MNIYLQYIAMLCVINSSTVTVKPWKVLQSACLRVCLYVCLCVCPLEYLKLHMSKFHEIFCTCYLWPWFGPHLSTTQYVMYFRFCGWRCFHIMRHIHWLGTSGHWRATRLLISTRPQLWQQTTWLGYAAGGLIRERRRLRLACWD